MKKLRIALILMAAPALVVAGLTQIGGNPVSKGQSTQFASWIDYSPGPRLALSTDAGDLSCWVMIKVPANAQPFSASLSAGTPLTVYTAALEGSFQWIAIVANGTKREEKFPWGSGSTVFVTNPDGKPGSITPSDWKVFLNNKDHDSQNRAKWRRILFVGSVILICVGLIGGALEIHSKLQKDAPVPFTPQRVLEELIRSTEGSSPEETRRRQLLLTKVLLERIPATEALDTLAPTFVEKRQLWFQTAPPFKRRLEWLISELAEILGRLNRPL